MNVADSTSPMHAAPTALRIMYVITKANWGGAQRNVFDLATAAHAAGFVVSVAAGDPYLELSDRLIEAGIQMFHVSGLGRDVSPTNDLRALSELTKLFRAHKPDVVHAHSSKAGLLAAIAAQRAGVKNIIFTAHGWAFNESRPWWQKIIFAGFHLLTLYAVDTVICVSNELKRQVAWMPFVQKKIIVIHNGVRPIEFVDKAQARAALAPLMSTPYWIGTLAELHPTKGLDIAINAFAEVAKTRDDVALVMIGEGQDRERLTALASSLHLTERIHFCGHISHAATYLKAFDIFLFPSRSEGLGYVALEAGSAKLPVVASTVGGIPEIIENEVSGVLLPVGDIAAFTKTLKKLLGAPERRAELGNALYDRVNAHFSEHSMIRDTIALYS